MPQTMINDYIEISHDSNRYVTLHGITSTTRDEERAMFQALHEADKEDIPVLIEIQWINRVGVKHFMINSSDYSPYYDEGEILLADGFPLKVMSINENYTVDIMNKKSNFRGKAFVYILLKYT